MKSSFVVLLGYAIVLYLLVRPGSQGPGLVNNVASGVQGVIRASTGDLTGAGWGSK